MHGSPEKSIDFLFYSVNTNVKKIIKTSDWKKSLVSRDITNTVNFLFLVISTIN